VRSSQFECLCCLKFAETAVENAQPVLITRKDRENRVQMLAPPRSFSGGQARDLSRRGPVEMMVVLSAQGAAQVAANANPATKISGIVRDPTDIPSSTGNRAATVLHVTLTAKEVVGQLDPSVASSYRYWTFNGKVPGPMIRAREGDTIEVTLRNDSSSHMVHSVDFHAAIGAGDGADFSQTLPGQSKTFTLGSVVAVEDPNIPSFVVDTVDELAPTCSATLTPALLRKALAKSSRTKSVAPLTVGMTAMAFTPVKIVIKAGQKVTWKNSSQVIHNVVDDDAKAVKKSDVSLPSSVRPFHSEFLQPGQVFTRVFTVPGIYRYVCTLHEGNGMKGTVIVK
jgi:plastocyanin